MPLLMAAAVGGKTMRTVAWIAVGYLALVGAATLYSAVGTSTPTSDTIAQLPSVGSLMGSTGTTAAVMDLAAAGAVWFFVLK
jgi:type IV secretory pathway VirB2 component (pilin)